MTPEQLRASILQQAMEGKLVKQDPNDEPASVLLEKITEEKARLIKEKKIKRTKKLPAITDEEKPFDIPGSWEWVRLGQLASSVRYGFTDSAKGSGNARFIRITDIQHGSVNWNNVPFCNVPSEKLDDLRLLNNDILIARTGGTVGKSFIVHDVEQTSVFASYLIRIRMVNIQLTNFIAYFLQSPLYWKAISEKQSGTGQPNVNASKLSEIIIPLPSLEEQKRIVAKIEKLMPLVDEYAEAYDKLKKLDDGFNDKLKQSLLQYAMEGKLVKQDPNDEPASVLLEKIAEEKARLIKEKKIKRTKKLPEITDDEKPFEIPDSWEWVRIGNLVNIYTGLSYNKSKLQEQSNDMVRVLRGGNINGSNYTVDLYDDDVMIDRKYLAKNNLLLKRGQLLTPSVTSDKQLGKIAIVSDDYNDIVAGGFIFNIVPFIDNEVFSKYFMFVFSSRFIKQQLLNAANKSGQAFYNVSKTKFQKLTLPIPPLAEQKRIVAKLDQLTAAIH